MENNSNGRVEHDGNIRKRGPETGDLSAAGKDVTKLFGPPEVVAGHTKYRPHYHTTHELRRLTAAGYPKSGSLTIASGARFESGVDLRSCCRNRSNPLLGRKKLDDARNGHVALYMKETGRRKTFLADNNNRDKKRRKEITENPNRKVRPRTSIHLKSD